MKTDTKQIIEIVGIFGVVASLIFVGMQLMQDRAVAMGSQYQSRAEIAIESSRTIIESPELLSATVKVSQGKPDSLTPEEQVAYDRKLVMDFLRSDNNLYQYELGLINEAFWISSRARTKDALRDEYTRSYYLRAMVPNSRRSMGELILQLIEEIESE